MTYQQTKRGEGAKSLFLFAVGRNGKKKNESTRCCCEGEENTCTQKLYESVLQESEHMRRCLHRRLRFSSPDPAMGYVLLLKKQNTHINLNYMNVLLHRNNEFIDCIVKRRQVTAVTFTLATAPAKTEPLPAAPPAAA